MAAGILGTLGLITVVLLMYNAYSDGAVSEGAHSFVFSDEDAWEEKRESAACFLGQVLFEPSYEKEILGQTVRIPRWELGDIFIAVFLTTITMLILNMVRTGHSIGIPKTILIFIAALIAIKLLGWLLIQIAGPDCITYHDRIGGSYADALEMGCGAGAIAMVWKLLKMRRGI
jgi:hypothetical protein